MAKMRDTDPVPEGLADRVIETLHGEPAPRRYADEAGVVRDEDGGVTLLPPGKRAEAIAVVREGETTDRLDVGMEAYTPFTFTRTKPDPTLAPPEYWDGYRDAETHIASLLGWTIQEAS